MKVVIIEDEQPALNRIRKLISEVAPEADVVATADSIESAVALFRADENIELALMDIELADGQSFEIFNRVTVKCPVIFTTAYDEFALKAFKVNSIDYLLKPVDKEELGKAITKFRLLQQAAVNVDYRSQFQALLKELKEDRKETYKNRFLIKTGTRLISVAAEDIAYLYASDKMVYLVTHKNQRYIIDHTLEELSRLLDPKHFFHLNRQLITSFASIQSIHTYFNGKLKIELLPAVNEEVMVSREKAAEFKEWLDR